METLFDVGAHLAKAKFLRGIPASRVELLDCLSVLVLRSKNHWFDCWRSVDLTDLQVANHMKLDGDLARNESHSKLLIEQIAKMNLKFVSIPKVAPLVKTNFSLGLS